MKNIINEKPTDTLSGRTLYTVNTFVSNDDIKNKKVLEIGCGFGWFLFHCLNNGVGEITGMEINENNLKTARTLKDNRLSFKVGSTIDLPFPDNNFDTICAWEILEHIPKNTENMMFKEINRVLKKDGVYYMSTPLSSFFSNVLDPAWWLIGHRHYSVAEITAFMNKNNFSLENVQIRGGWAECFGTINLYISKWILRRRPLFEGFFQRLRNKEFKKEKGFTNIFAKGRCI